jgi:tRNA (guanine-N7-)-methyltransferase
MEINYNKCPLPDRKRHHTNPSYYIPITELKVVPNGYPKIIENVNWQNYFINGKKPNKLDIGCGKGLFLLTLADNDKNSNILGIEVRQWCCDWLQNYILSEKIDNCGILRYCVANGLDFIEKETINEIFYLFPDPWVKKKHNKRRAFNLYFLNEIYRLLEKNGKLYLATDLKEVHQYHLDILKEFNILKFKEIISDAEWGILPTNKELFCIKENIQCYKIIAVK